MRINLKSFKKVRENTDTATLKNERGHEITLSKKSLRPHILKTLSQLPVHLFEDGEVPAASDYVPQSPDTVPLQAPPAPTMAPTAGPDYSKMYEHFYQQEKQFNPGAPDAQSRMNALNMVGGIKAQNEHSQQGDYESSVSAQHAAIEENSRRAALGLAPMPVPQPLPNPTNVVPPPQDTVPAGSPVVSPEPQQPQIGAAPPPQDPYGNEAFANYSDKGLNESVKGIGQRATAAGQLGADQYTAAKQSQDAQLTLQQRVEKTHSDIDTEIVNVLHDLENKHLDPNRFWDSRNGWQKAAILVGLAGGANPKIIDDAINRDIDAQKHDFQNKDNLINAQFKRMGNMRDAVDMSRLIQASLYAARLQMAASSATDPMAQAEKHAQLGQLYSTYAPIARDLAIRRTLMQQDPNAAPGSETQFLKNKQMMQFINPEEAKRQESMYLPGIGTTRVPVKDEDKNAFALYSDLEQKLNRAINFAHQKGTTMWGTEANQQAADIQNAIQLNIGRLEGLNRINEFEASKYKKMAGNPGAFKTTNAVQSFEDLKKDIAEKRKSEFSKLGITPFAGQGVVLTKPGQPPMRFLPQNAAAARKDGWR